MIDTSTWRHAFKLDPDKDITDEHLEALCESGTDAIIVGGTLGVTFDHTIDLLSRIRRYALPCILEISNREAIVPGFDHYFIPVVLNAKNPKWLFEPHIEVIKELGTIIPWHDISTVGYCVLNRDSSVAKLTESDTELTVEDVLAYGRLATHVLNLPYFYIEYSGVYGDIELVKEVYGRLGKSENGKIQMIYGGGISDKRQAEAMNGAADMIVVGNLIYENIEAALQTVVKEEVE
ncbi:heptaprenylglyceryl phosphate synthase [Bacillus horti]|uniref:Heptaprenylglyceryl phosphate synthase n=1 Tax=Caldalkalibacillus horti TaxID=77523 RepID=A0ABT9W1W9_9BACI|nr:heptaprenylglyceryl phosphate synthase [Bacillus horti]MDQ0167236.1 putative glycerol-1-phosphate prenyltransferase [Bacillus horti]